MVGIFDQHIGIERPLYYSGRIEPPIGHYFTREQICSGQRHSAGLLSPFVVDVDRIDTEDKGPCYGREDQYLNSDAESHLINTLEY